MSTTMRTVQPVEHSPTSAPPAGVTAADHLRAVMGLLLHAERGRTIATVENGEEVIRLGLCLLPDLAFRQIGTHLLAALEVVEGGG